MVSEGLEEVADEEPEGKEDGEEEEVAQGEDEGGCAAGRANWGTRVIHGKVGSWRLEVEKRTRWGLTQPPQLDAAYRANQRRNARGLDALGWSF